MIKSLTCRLAFLWCGVLVLSSCAAIRSSPQLERIVVGSDGQSFVTAQSKTPFTPWGVNYGNTGRLMEDFWDNEWSTLADDFREIRTLGANVVRVHLQFGKFMNAPDQPNAHALKQLGRMLALAESNGLYLDLTGLACYRTSDVPAWYDKLDDTARWNAQANFWRAIAAECAHSPAVFCYDLMNEPISPGSKGGKWYSGQLLGGYDFIQFIARDPAGRTRAEVASQWIDKLTAAIREKDTSALITVGMLPWVTGWKHLSGFVPREIAPHVSFISVHIYPKTKQPDEAMIALRECDVGKPLVIEETFALECSIPELETFLRSSRSIARGWVWHYDGLMPDEYDAIARTNNLSVAQSMWQENLRSFLRMKNELIR